MILTALRNDTDTIVQQNRNRNRICSTYDLGNASHAWLYSTTKEESEPKAIKPCQCDVKTKQGTAQ